MTEYADHLFAPRLEEETIGLLASPTYDAWQAASLLVGLYGLGALGYAHGQRDELRAQGESDAARTWDLIISQIEHIVMTVPAPYSA